MLYRHVVLAFFAVAALSVCGGGSSGPGPSDVIDVADVPESGDVVDVSLPPEDIVDVSLPPDSLDAIGQPDVAPDAEDVAPDAEDVAPDAEDVAPDAEDVAPDLDSGGGDSSDGGDTGDDPVGCGPQVLPLPCGSTVTYDTTGEVRLIDSYDCFVELEETGPELWFSVAPAEDMRMQVVDRDANPQLQLFLLHGGCGGGDCVAWGTGTLSYTLRGGETWHVVADGLFDWEGSVTLAFLCEPSEEQCADGLDNDFDGLTDCQQEACDGAGACEFAVEQSCDDGLDNDGDGSVDCFDRDCATLPICAQGCAAETEIVCGETVNATFAQGEGSAVDHYDCVDWDFAGAEKIYRFVPTADGPVIFHDTQAAPDVRLALMRGACASTACVNAGMEFLAHEVRAGTEYFLAVEASGTPDLPVPIRLQCAAEDEICDDFADNDFDGVVDCADPDCDGAAGSAGESCEPGGELSCADGLDNDGDQRADCADEDCAAVPACAGDCVGTPTPISCGETLVLDTLDGASGIDRYACQYDFAETGPEAVWLFEPLEDAPILFRKVVPNADVHLFLLGDACAGADCLAMGTDEIMAEVAAGERYHLVADGYEGYQGRIEVSLQCGPQPEVCDDGLDNDFDEDIDCADEDCDGRADCEFGVELTCADGHDNDGDGGADCHDSDCWVGGTCAAACAGEIRSIACGDEITMNSADGSDTLVSYGCIPGFVEDGPELVFAFTATEDDVALFRDMDAEPDLDLWLLEDHCATDACVASGLDALPFDVVAGTTYYLVADARWGWEGPVHLRFLCGPQVEECADGIDNDFDRLYDCADDDCAGVGTCEQPEQSCDDGLDNDGDYRVDCRDQDCVGAPACPGLCPEPATSLVCNTTYEAVLSGGDSAIDVYGCTSMPQWGEERVFRYTPAVDERVSFAETDDRDDVDLFLLADTCTAASCEAAHVQNLTAALEAGHTYYFLVDSDEGATGTVPLYFQCGESPEICDDGLDNDFDGGTDCGDDACIGEASCFATCAATGSIACGETVTVDTTGISSQVEHYGCFPGFREDGGEVVLSFTAPTSEPVLFRELDDHDWLDLFWLDDVCDNAHCSHFHLHALWAWVQEGETYYLVADGRDGRFGEARLQLLCGPQPEVCDDGIDNDLDGDDDCQDDDCDGVGFCERPSERSCGDGEDNDGDWVVDCHDRDCVGDPACPGQCSGSPAVLSCDSAFVANLDGLSSAIDMYSCNGVRAWGPEIAYTFTPEEDMRVAFGDSSEREDVNLYLLEETCAASACAGFQSTTLLADLQAGQTYYFVVDSGEDVGGEVPLYFQCGPDDEICTDGLDNDLDGDTDCEDGDCIRRPDCAQGCGPDVPTIDCEDVIAVDTSGDSSHLANYPYPCDWSQAFPAPELVRAFTPSADMDVVLHDPDGHDNLVTVFVLEGGCDNQSCIASDRTGAAFHATAGTTYYLVADGTSDAAAGELRLELQCGPRAEICDDELDNDFDGEADCLDADCDGVDVCEYPAERSCADGEDNDGDWLADCRDPDCLGDPACPGLCEGTPVALTCGTSYSPTLDGQPAAIDVYGCGSAWTWGAELVYTFTPDTDFRISLLDIADRSDVTLHLLEGACEATACAAYDSQNLVADLSAGETYYFVADSYNGATGEVPLYFQCGPEAELCSDGRDNDLDGETDCGDTDCVSEPDCAQACGPGVSGIACDDVITWNTSAGTSTLAHYPCFPYFDESGPELVFSFTPG